MPIEHPSPTPPRRWQLILHGKAAQDDDIRAAVQAMRDSGIDLAVRVTWEPGDAERYADEAIDAGVEVLVAGGGDGTVSVLAASLARREADGDRLPALAILPLGTANDLARAAGIPEEPDACLALVRDTPATPVDLLRIGADGQVGWCVNLASGGFGTEATTEADEGLKKVLGGLAYWLTGVARLGRIEPQRARLSGPGFEWQGDFIALGVGNGRQAGGGQPLCPEAVIDDGRLDLTVIPPLEGAVGQTLAAVFTEGKVEALESVAIQERLAWLEIEADAPLALNLDGEPAQARRYRIDCVARRIRMHLPPGCPLLGVPGNPAGLEPPGPAPVLQPA